jgi:hemolysin III
VVRADSTAELAEAVVAPAPVRPRLRGHLHLLSVPFSVAGLVWLVTTARTPLATVAAAVYGGAAVALYTVSSGYHVLARGTRARRVMQRLDHATIYIAIAGTYTPLCLLALHGPVRPISLLAVWVAALTGAAMRLLSWDRFKRFGAALYIVLGWAGIILLPALRTRPGLLALIASGGLLYTVGAALFAARWPRPEARWFGFHEVWHVFVVAAGALFFAANASLITAAS